MSVRSNGTEGDQASWDASISDSGRFVAFGPEATTFVDGDTADGDVFVRGPLH